MMGFHVPAQSLLVGESEATYGADGLATVPGHVLAASRIVGQKLATVRHGADRRAA